jgi:hypothetical protein
MTTTQSYKCQAKFFLEDTFDWVSCMAIKSVFEHVGCRFADAHAILVALMAARRDDDVGRAVFPHLPLNVKIFLKRRRSKKNFYVRDERLREEIRSIDALQVKNDHRDVAAAVNVHGLTEKDDDDDADEEANHNPRVFECLCCFGEYPAEEIKGVCNANALHYVCQGCINSYVREQVDGKQQVNFTCIVDNECKGVYPSTLLDQVLTPKLKRRTHEAVFRHEVEQSGINAWYVHCEVADD